MLTEILRFELSRQVRALSTRIYLLLFAALGFLWMTAVEGAFPNASISFGGDKIFLNGPYSLFESISAMSYLGLLIISAISGRVAYQDFDDQMHSFFFTSPISKRDYLAGRYVAAVIVLVVILAAAALGMWLATFLPNVDGQRLESNHFDWYVQPILIIIVPNVIIMSAIFFSMAALSRRILPVYMTSVLLLTGYLVASGELAKNLQYRVLAAMLDPFGDEAIDRVTEYWTISEKNSLMLWPQGVLLWNRALWLSIAAAILAYTYYKFRFTYSNSAGFRFFRRRKTAAIAEAPLPLSRPITRIFSISASLRALFGLSWLGFIETVKNIYFAVILLAGIIFMAVSAHELGDWYGTQTYPVTYEVLDMAGGAFALFVLIIITYYSGELVWRERDARTHELFDSLPLPTWTQFLSKLLALFYVLILLSVVVMLTGMGVQLFKGYTHLEPGLYVKILGLRLIDYTLLAALAITVQTLVNNKYLGHGVMVLYYVASTFMGQFGLEHRLYNYGSHPGYTYSDMNGFGHQLRGVFWFDAYWTVLALLLLLLAYLMWVRGLAANPRARFAIARSRFRTPQGVMGGLALVLLAALGAFIIYNTNYLHIFRSKSENEKLAVRYEHDYRKYLNSPQPRITSISYHADLYPERLSIRFSGKYGFTNKTSQPIDRVLVTVPEVAIVHRLEFSVPAREETRDRPEDLFIYRFNPPLAPGQTGELAFDLEYTQHGFQNGGDPTEVAYNGTFISSDSLPQFGYQEGQELSEDKTRRKYKLQPKPRMYDLYNASARRNTYASQDSDWITFDATVSTSADQIALAPGELVREWSEGGRRNFQYQTRGKVLNMSSVLSARYQVVRDRWNDVALEIYYQPGHEYNLAKMMTGMKKALEYCTTNFSPYQNKTVRIIEFPRYQSFAQSFPASIPFSESIGFIARVDPTSDEDVDYPFYVTAHEVAHQWWAHQVIGGNVQGATMLSESMAEYTAMMVLKREYGPEHMRRFLKYEMDRYLNGRSGEPDKELPLVRVEGQDYIHYSKGSVVFYALQDYAGEENINRALREYVQAVAYQEPPYTFSPELVTRLRAVVPQAYLYAIGDMLESITLYENRAVSATARKLPDGSYTVSLKVKSRKVKAGELGEEKELPLADWIDIAVLDAHDKPLYLERKLIDKSEMEFKVNVKGLPAKAGIDPWNKLVDRDPNDNTMKVTLGG
jgi:ABC-2 type transport system permease protein